MLTLPRNRVCKHRYMKGSPSAQQASQNEESRVVNWLGKNISKLLSSGNVLDIDITYGVVRTTYPASEMVVLDCNMFSSRKTDYLHVPSGKSPLMECAKGKCSRSSLTSFELE